MIAILGWTLWARPETYCHTGRFTMGPPLADDASTAYY